MNKKLDASEAIQLGDKILRSKNNSFLYFTGDNGSGKSTLLLDIAKKIARENRELSVASELEFDRQKIIAYSLAPFSKFDSRDAFHVTRDEGFERIGGGSSGTARYALLFQAIVQFCLFDSTKQPLYQEIAEITRFSAIFKVRLRIDRSRFERYPREAVDNNRIARSLLNAEGAVEVFMRPGMVKINVESESTLPPSEFEYQSTFDELDDSQSIAEALMLLRRFGALRVIRVEYAKLDDTWCSSDNLSSGQLSFFVGLMVLASALTDNCTVLIDEPEISLHPAWQEKYPLLLHKMAKYYKGCKFYVATHSPMIVSSAKKRGGKIINLGTELIKPTDMDSADFSSIEEIFAIYFNTLTLDSHFVKEIIVKAIQALSDERANDFKVYSNIIRNLRPKIKDTSTKKLIAEILKRAV